MIFIVEINCMVLKLNLYELRKSKIKFSKNVLKEREKFCFKIKTCLESNIILIKFNLISV